MLRISRPGLTFLFALLAAPVAGAAPTMVNLGKDILPQAVSDNGKVIAGLSIRENAPGVFRWTPTAGVEVIGGLVAGRPDVSADGVTISGTVFTDRAEAAFWKEGKWTPLSATGLLPALPGWDTYAEALSANGKRIAGGTLPPPVDYGWVRAFDFNPDKWIDRWADYGWVELPLAGKGGFASATSISNDGHVQVGLASDRGSWFFAARWIDGHVEQLLDADGQRLGGETVACDSTCGAIAGGGGGSSAFQPVLAWRLRANRDEPACYFEPLKGPPLPALRHYAYSTSEGGKVIVGTYYYDVFDGGFGRNVAKGFLWLADAQGGTLVDLQEYLASLGQPFMRNWLNVVAVGVSRDGRYLVGWGHDAQEQVRGWRIDFGKAPQVTAALPASSSHTRCPTQAHSTAEGAPAASASAAQTWVPTHAVFRTGDGGQYHVNLRGLAVHGGTSEDPMMQRQLVALGGDHYYDLGARTSLSLVRDSAGLVQAMRVRRAGKTSLWFRQGN